MFTFEASALIRMVSIVDCNGSQSFDLQKKAVL